MRRTLRVETPPAHHLHQGQHQGLFAALVPRKKFGGESAVPRLGYGQIQGAYPSVERAGFVPVALPLAFRGAFIGLGPQIGTFRNRSRMVFGGFSRRIAQL